MLTARVCPTCAVPVTEETGVEGLCPACLFARALEPSDAVTHGEHEVETLAAGSTVGAFRLVRLIGKGGMATVYEAYDAALDRSVALKILPREFLHDRTFADRFQREARLVASLEHPNIVPIYATGIDNGVPWMSMRLLPAGALGSELARKLPVERRLQVLRGVAAALDYAHAHGVIHRDIKPSNILLDDGDHVCVADFGVARVLEGPALTGTGHIVGTPQYMAPEQALGLPLDRRCDLYSLGVVAYEMFTGTLPFDGPSLIGVLTKHVNDPVPMPARSIVKDTTWRVLLEALQKEPAKRWPTAAAFVDALEASLGEPAPVPRGHRVVMAVMATTAGALLIVRLGMPGAPRPPEITSELRAKPLHATVVLKPAVVMNPPGLTLNPTLRLPVALHPSAAKKELGSPLSSDAPVTPDYSSGSNASPIRRGIVAPNSESRPNVTPDSSPPSVVTKLPEPSPTQPVDKPDVLTAPVITYSVETPYPQLALAAQLEGDVLLEAQVSATGEVTEVRVLRSAHPVLDEAARKSVLQYRYTPASRNGQPVATITMVTVSFRLK